MNDWKVPSDRKVAQALFYLCALYEFDARQCGGDYETIAPTTVAIRDHK